MAGEPQGHREAEEPEAQQPEWYLVGDSDWETVGDEFEVVHQVEEGVDVSKELAEAMGEELLDREGSDVSQTED